MEYGKGGTGMQIGLLGYGTVGKAFYALCEEQPTLKVNTLLTRRPRVNIKVDIIEKA